ncbi:MAG: aldehyde ferredoxin oxidoreductase C-terminal domain-containing protein [Desulfuromonadaceae bacterium]|nr:aldehyde ferredoxin oxidoreductase C-terminal domain-containing protein [Desulfuromonadaceae bacterium]
MNYSRAKLQNGYANQILTVDVTSRLIETPPLDPKIKSYFLGGRGLGLYLLHQATTACTEPGDPENPLIFANGPLGGIPQFPGTAKAMAISLSPLTGIAGVSNFGGYFGAYLKYAGFDALQITGRADTDVMIVIDGFKNEVTVIDITSTDQVFDLEHEIVERFTAAGHDKRNMAFMTTGRGAATTSFGCINSHYFDVTKPAQDGSRGVWRTKQAGRTGLGTVMIQKNIHAIVVLATHPHGDNPYGAADWEGAKQAGARLHKVVKEVDPHSLKMYRKGSAGLIPFMNKHEYQSLPVNNYQAGSDSRADRISGKFYAENLFEHRGMDGCFPGCNLMCTKGGWVTLTTGNHAGQKVWVDGPEYETAAGFGSNIGIWNPKFIMEANWHCDNYGIDTITSCVLIAFLMECFQRGYLNSAEADGLELTFGNEEAAMTFLHRIALGEGELARTAGKGMLALVALVAELYMIRATVDIRPELDRFAMQTKGLPFSLYRTHRSLSMQGSYAAASDIGAHHAAAWLIKADLLGAFPTFEEKAKALMTYPRVRLGNDNMGLCKLPWVDVFNPESTNRVGADIYINPASQEIYADFYNAVLGDDLTWQEIFAHTDRDINLQRVLNVLRFGGQTAEKDWIPERAIGPTEDRLYESEAGYNDGELSRILSRPLDEIEAMPTSEKRLLLMDERRGNLKKLVEVYYEERGWNDSGIPTPATLHGLGLWEFLTDEARMRITELNG